MIKHLLCLTTVAVAVCAAPAQASCLRLSEREQVRRADAVFVGRVLSVRQRDGSATFRVLSVRKGRVHKDRSVRVFARPYPSSITIDWRPRIHQRWRIYAHRTSRGSITNDCMGTRRL